MISLSLCPSCTCFSLETSQSTWYILWGWTSIHTFFHHLCQTNHTMGPCTVLSQVVILNRHSFLCWGLNILFLFCLIQCVVPQHIHISCSPPPPTHPQAILPSLPQKGSWRFQGVLGPQRPQNLKGSTKLNWNSQRVGVGGLSEDPFREGGGGGGVNIFWNYTIA